MTFEIDTGLKKWTPSKHDLRPWVPLPPSSDWRLCACHAFVTVRYVHRDGKERYQEICPACLALNPSAKTNLGRDKAIDQYGSWRVENAIERASFKTLPEWERVGRARRWIWQARYQEHLTSPQWAEIRSRVFDMYGHCCARCNNPAEHAHHITYDRLGSENVNDLEPLCRECHWAEHERVF